MLHFSKVMEFSDSSTWFYHPYNIVPISISRYLVKTILIFELVAQSSAFKGITKYWDILHRVNIRLFTLVLPRFLFATVGFFSFLQCRVSRVILVIPPLLGIEKMNPLALSVAQWQTLTVRRPSFSQETSSPAAGSIAHQSICGWCHLTMVICWCVIRWSKKCCLLPLPVWAVEDYECIFGWQVIKTLNLSDVQFSLCFSLSLFRFLGGHLSFFLASYSQYRSEDGRVSSATRPSSAGSGQIYTPTVTSTPTPTPTRTTSSPSINAPNKTGKSHWQSGKYLYKDIL